MIHIDRETLSDGSIVIKVDGRLNRETVEPLSELCERYLKNGKKVWLDIEGITHTDESGGKYIMSLRNRVKFLRVPEFLRLKYQMKLEVKGNLPDNLRSKVINSEVHLNPRNEERRIK